MMIPHTFKGRNVAVLGLGRSGRTSALALQKAGARVVAWDDTPKAREAAEAAGVNLEDLTDLNWNEVGHLVLSPGIPHHYPAPHPVVARAQLAGLRPISDMEILCKTQPHAKYVGITGTNGKSTTTALIGHILKVAGKPCEVGGNIGIPVMALNPLEEEGTYVLEMSSYQLEITPSLHFDVSLLLNISPDHLDRHGGLEGYIAAKKLIYKNSTAQDTVVIGVDDPFCQAIYEELKALGTVKVTPISASKSVPEGVYVKDGQLVDDKPVCDLVPLVPLKGQHNWQNAAAAYAVAKALGIEASQIAQALESFAGLEHRQQLVKTWNHIRFVNDSKATNAEAVAQALACYQTDTIYWLLGGRSKEGGIESLESFFPKVHHAFVYGEAQEKFALSLEGKVPFTKAVDLKEATAKATQMATAAGKENSVVLLSPACSSFDQFKDFEVRGQAFCEYVDEVIVSSADMAAC